MALAICPGWRAVRSEVTRMTPSAPRSKPAASGAGATCSSSAAVSGATGSSSAAQATDKRNDMTTNPLQHWPMPHAGCFPHAVRATTCRHAGSPPFARHTLSARKTTATGRSPGLRVVAAGAPSRGDAPMACRANHSPLTVAGAAAVLHRIPYCPSGRECLPSGTCRGAASIAPPGRRQLSLRGLSRPARQLRRRGTTSSTPSSSAMKASMP